MILILITIIREGLLFQTNIFIDINVRLCYNDLLNITFFIFFKFDVYSENFKNVHNNN